MIVAHRSLVNGTLIVVKNKKKKKQKLFLIPTESAVFKSSLSCLEKNSREFDKQMTNAQRCVLE